MSLRQKISKAAIMQLAADSRGNVAIIFALALLPILLATGAAIDYGRANSLRVRIQAALDATGLMIAQNVGTMPIDDLADQADEIFEANFVAQDGVVIAPLDVDIDNDAVRLAATAQIDTTIMALGGIDVMNVGASTEIVRAEDSYEVVLVLDNTGSMRGSKIRALQEATELLINNLFGESESHPLLDMGLVPFSHAVNVGTSNKNASWMDTRAANPIHWELFDEEFKDRRLTRFDLYDALNERWPGCVEARKYPLDVNDVPANGSDPDTLFVPYFYPDEPGDSRRPDNHYVHSYLDDKVSGRRPSDEEKQKNTAKYFSRQRVRGEGPTRGCTSRPILALTNSKSKVLDAVDDMDANGYTNITEGLMWGLRVISPGAPFTEGKPYDTEDHHKIIILLTDGRNQVPGYGRASSFSNRNINGSEYGPYGFATSGRLLDTHNIIHFERAMNNRTAEACEAVKAEGVQLFTITFEVSDRDTEALMRNCATDPDMYYNSPNTNTLKSVFKAIASRISELRISK